MRLNARDMAVTVAAIPDTNRPVRMKAAGLVFSFTTPEALELAHHLADAVDEIRKQERRQEP